MKARFFLLKTVLFAAFATAFISCSDNDEPEVPVEKEWWQKEGAYILNQGKFTSNNAELGYYISEEKKYQEVFETANEGLKLGDTGQDMVIYGSKIYVAVYNSGIIRVLDRAGKQIQTIESKKNGTLQNPRYFTTYQGKVYVTYYDGYLAQIDTTSLQVVKDVKVGNNPEYVTITNGKLYVANSGGMNYPNYDKTVSVVDPATMSKTKDIEVAPDPVQLLSDKEGDVYLISWTYPNYTLQRIDGATDQVTTITTAHFMAINPAGDKIYGVVSPYSANPITAEFFTYDTVEEKLSQTSFVTDGTIVKSFCSLNVDPSNGDIYIGTSNSVESGDMYVFTSAGVLKDKFQVGLNVAGAFFPKN